MKLDTLSKVKESDQCKKLHPKTLARCRFSLERAVNLNQKKRREGGFE